MFRSQSTLICICVMIFMIPKGNGDVCKNGKDCKNIISMPLLDNMQASLKAELDVTEMNKAVKFYIQQEIDSAVESAFRTKVETIVQNYTVDAERIIQKYMKDSMKYPAFFVPLTLDKVVLRPSDKIKFNHVITNIGNGYNPATGIFTAPMSGVYSFQCTVMTTGGTVGIRLNRNNNLLINGFVPPQDGATHNMAAVVSLNKNDKVHVSHRHGNPETIYGRFHTTFSGYMLHK